MMWIPTRNFLQSLHENTREATIKTPQRNNKWLLLAAGILLIGASAPNPELTPGVADPLATKDMVCTAGYTATVRHVTVATKRAVFKEYGVTDYKTKKYEVDHLISLELGGSNDIKNLWPQPYFENPGARQKDSVENFLHRQVCAGEMTLSDAQKLIVSDWLKVYRSIHP